MVSDKTVTTEIPLTILRSISDSSLLSIIGWSGQLFGYLSHTGPSPQFCPSWPILQPLLPKSTGFCFAGMYFQFLKPFPFFLFLSYRLKTNILYSPLSFNQFKVTVLLDHACTYFILNLLRLHFKFPTKFEDTCVAISSGRGIDKFFLANQYLLVIRLWLTCSVDKLLCKRQWILHLYWHH